MVVQYGKLIILPNSVIVIIQPCIQLQDTKYCTIQCFIEIKIAH